MAAETAADLFEHELEDVYFAEHELVEAYERMAEHAHDERVRRLLESHASETGEHVERLVEVFEETGEPPRTEECEGIEGLLVEWEAFVEENEPGPIMDYYSGVRKSFRRSPATRTRRSRWQRFMNTIE
jgi:ferritin-like metal-binding protein YciE